MGRRGARLEAGLFAAEGIHAVQEALASPHPIEVLYAGPGADEATIDRARRAGAEIVRLRPGVMERVSDTVTPQPLVAVVPFVHVDLDMVIDRARSGDAGPVVVAAAVTDPGNLGTIIRSAEASGASGVVCCDGTVDVYNPKTIRSSAGAVFHAPIVAGGTPADVVGRLNAAGVRVVATAAAGGDDYTAVDLTGPLALVLGNEAHGLPAGLAVDLTVTIPIFGRAESLNVAVAASLLCFEAARQRRGAPC